MSQKRRVIAMIIGRFADQRGGMAAVEFSLVAIFFIMLILGIEEVARYVAIRQDLMSAVHGVGRYAIVHGASSSSPASAATLQTLIGNSLVMVNAASITSSATFSPNNSSGSTVTITANYTWTPIAAILHLPSANIVVTSTATILH